MKVREAEERLKRYRRGHPEVPLEGRVVIIADDGIATGLTVEAAIRSTRLRNPSRIVLASPVASREAVEYLHP
ncbi:MAG: phosphoribosyltransferase family protein, partial [Nitrososphaerota archaeon]